MEKQFESIVPTALDAWAERGKKSAIQISGNSMKPILADGAKIVVEHGLKRLRFGDIVLFQQEGILTAHRIVRVYNTDGKRRYRTKGDRTLRFDPQRLDDEKILGKVTGVIKGGRAIPLQTRLWDILGLILATFSLFVGSIFALMKGPR